VTRGWTTILLDVPGDSVLLPGDSMIITRRLDRDVDGRKIVAFRPREFSFADADHWSVADFKIGFRSQFERAVTVPAAEILTALYKDCEVLQQFQEFSMDVIADRPGLSFCCRLSGEYAGGT
jgi:hypothetical protein